MQKKMSAFGFTRGLWFQLQGRNGILLPYISGSYSFKTIINGVNRGVDPVKIGN